MADPRWRDLWPPAARPICRNSHEKARTIMRTMGIMGTMIKRCLSGILLLALVGVLCSSRSSNPIDDRGYYKGVCLKGKVFYVDDPYEPYDFGAYLVEKKVAADLWVWDCAMNQITRPGDWAEVNRREDADFTVHLMGSADTFLLGRQPDFYICFVKKYREAGVNPFR